MENFPLKYVSILENEFIGMNDIFYWLLVPIAKKLSTYSGYLLLHISFISNIFRNDDYPFYNPYKDEYPNIDLPYGQITKYFGILESSLELE